MGKSKATARPAQAAGIGHNSGLVIEKLTADYHAFTRKNVFDEGDLLIKIKDACEKYGDWGKWVGDKYKGSRDTADRHILAARLAATFRTVRQLRVPATIIYELASIYFDDKPADSDDYKAKDVEVAIPALVKADKASEAALTEKECWETINRACRQAKWGNYPDEMLLALEEMIPADAPWAEAAIADLKKRRLKTEEDAARIVTEIHFKHVNDMYTAPPGTLPRWLNRSSLDLLEAVPEERRAEIAAKLNPDQPLPANPEELHKLVVALVEANGEDAAQPAEPSSPSPPSPEPEPIGRREGDESTGKHGGGGGSRKTRTEREREHFEDSFTYLEQSCERAGEGVIDVPHLDRAAADAYLARLETAINNLLRFKEKINKSALKNSDGNDVDAVATGAARMALNAADDPDRWRDSA